MFEARLYRKLEKGMVQCLACEWKCKILEGKTGVCGVRKNEKGRLYLLVYGKPVAVNVDPIEKKPLYHFLPGSKILSIGTVGCNLKCGFCQNWEISQNREVFGESISPEKIVSLAVRSKIPSIAFTYNEPTIWTEYAVEIMKVAKKKNIFGVYVSNGYMSNETFDYVEGYIDAYNIDLKGFKEEFYRKICHASLEPVLRNIKEIYKRRKWLEITTLVVPGKNDSQAELKRMAEFIYRVSPFIPWHLSAFHPDYQMMNLEGTREEKLLEAIEIGKKVGLKYVYGQDTYCPKCGVRLVARQGFVVWDNKIVKGKCSACGHKMEGVWE